MIQRVKELYKQIADAHERADAELHELVASTLDDALYLNCELYKYPRTINEIV